MEVMMDVVVSRFDVVVCQVVSLCHCHQLNKFTEGSGKTR
jgi:hypothetical protein